MKLLTTTTYHHHDWLNVQRNGDVLDATVGAAGELTLLVAPATRDTRFVAPARAYLYHESLGCWLELGDADSEVG